MRSIIVSPDKIRCGGEIILLDSHKPHCRAAVSSFDAAIFEVDVRVDGSKVRRGSCPCGSGRCCACGETSGEAIDSYDMKEDGGAQYQHTSYSMMQGSYIEPTGGSQALIGYRRIGVKW